jgi:RNA polymerase sporulation-specific sigma factor
MTRLTDEQRKMIEDNLAFVTYVAKKYFSKTDYRKNQDIIQEGIYAMTKAIPKWDPEKGKLTTYLYPTIDGHLKRYAYYQDRLIPIPHQNHLKKETMAKAEIAKNVYSLDLKYKGNSGEENFTLLHILPDKKTEDTDTLSTDKLVILDAVSSTLDWRERLIIAYRFYFDLDQTFIGKLMGISQVHCHRLEKRALAKIKTYMTK